MKNVKLEYIVEGCLEKPGKSLSELVFCEYCTKRAIILKRKLNYASLEIGYRQ